jgi:alpha-L-rhamnosidase
LVISQFTLLSSGSVINDASWKQVLIVDGPQQLKAQRAAPLKVMETFSPKNVTALSARTWVYHLAQNASGIPEVTVEGSRGDTIRIYPGELTRADGKVNQRPTGSMKNFLTEDAKTPLPSSRPRG